MLYQGSAIALLVDNMPGSKSNYTNVGLPTPLAERIKKYIAKHPEKGFTSVSDFVRHATIEKMETYKE